MSSKTSYLLVSFLFLSATVSAKPHRFDFRDAGGRNIIHFVSDATIEKTIGLSNSVAGWIEIDPDRIGEGIRGEFEVDVRTFHTGVELRNEYLRDKVMGAGEYPNATFTVGKVMNTSKSKLLDGAPVSLRVEGTLKARGTARAQMILVRLTYFRESEMTRQRLPGNLLKMSATFDLDTAQLNVQIPEAQRSRLSRFVQVSVDAVGTDQTPALQPPSEPSPPKDAKDSKEAPTKSGK